MRDFSSFFVASSFFLLCSARPVVSFVYPLSKSSCFPKASIAVSRWGDNTKRTPCGCSRPDFPKRKNERRYRGYSWILAYRRHLQRCMKAYGYYIPPHCAQQRLGKVRTKVCRCKSPPRLRKECPPKKKHRSCNKERGLFAW